MKPTDTPAIRDLNCVLNQMIQAIPTDAEGRDLIIHRFNKHRDDILYTAPEMISYQWRRVADSLEQFFGTGQLNNWQQQVVNIFINKA